MYKINCKQMINVMYHTSEDNKSRFEQQESTFIVVIIYYLLTENEVEVWDFPVMTERTRLISYLLYGLFSAILKNNTMKPPEGTFHIRLRALGLSSSLIRKKYLYARFFFQLLKI